MAHQIFNPVFIPCVNYRPTRLGASVAIPGHDLNQCVRLAIGGTKMWGKGREGRLPNVNRAKFRVFTPGNFSLADTAKDIDNLFLEVCVENAGRPAAAALTDFVCRAMDAFLAGCSLKKLLLEIEFAAAQEEVGFRLTASERSYRQQWLDIVYIAMQMLVAIADGEEGFHRVESLRPWREQDHPLMTMVQRTLKGQMTGEEQAVVKFDRALATRGASGGVAAEERTIAPQFVPVSQLVLLTSKVYKERNAK